MSYQPNVKFIPKHICIIVSKISGLCHSQFQDTKCPET